MQFDRISAKIESYSKPFYLLAYCSPAPAGRHRRCATGGTYLTQGGLGWAALGLHGAGSGSGLPNERLISPRRRLIS